MKPIVLERNFIEKHLGILQITEAFQRPFICNRLSTSNPLSTSGELIQLD